MGGIYSVSEISVSTVSSSSVLCSIDTAGVVTLIDCELQYTWLLLLKSLVDFNLPFDFLLHVTVIGCMQ